MQKIAIKGYTITLDSGLGEHPRDNTNIGTIYSFGQYPFGEVHCGDRSIESVMEAVRESTQDLFLPLYRDGKALTAKETGKHVGFIHAPVTRLKSHFRVATLT